MSFDAIRAGIERLRSENARLIGLLKAFGIASDFAAPPAPESGSTGPTLRQKSANLNAAEKVALFRDLFRGRTDVYAVR